MALDSVLTAVAALAALSAAAVAARTLKSGKYAAAASRAYRELEYVWRALEAFQMIAYRPPEEASPHAWAAADDFNRRRPAFLASVLNLSLKQNDPRMERILAVANAQEKPFGMPLESAYWDLIHEQTRCRKIWELMEAKVAGSPKTSRWQVWRL